MTWLDELMWASATNVYIDYATSSDYTKSQLRGYWNRKENKMNENKIDPWEHRHEGMKCKSCMWFAPKKQKHKPEIDLGRCRRHAPTMNGYPVVFVNDWCGDHKLNENWK